MRANQGAPGIDDETIAAFEVNLRDNRYRLWNRMSSGSYFPPPVKVVEIPKKSGGQRRLGIPTVSDRLAQMVVKLVLEPVVEPLFHPDSYGYRPGKSALAAVGITRERCWQYDWVLEFDIRAAFDIINNSLLLKALARLAESLNKALVKWVMRKYARFKGHQRRARQWLAAVADRAPGFFAHWEGGKAFAPAGR